ncbi:hypothetical protein [Metabacillus iocasae]|uniref:Swarming motility protein SwrB n=1 Tax=Priestia iocasae TaxID=2291674 RepID=A0ABS2QR09_9BACI|nr:hypothetical protein [Metabacillus iocasae]MBM7701891.1 hypothetical protein [Metabacillus iocasae]
MTTFLIIFSFLIHGLSLLCIVLLYMQLSRVKELEKKQQQTVYEMEQIILAYVTEMKEQNEEFFHQLGQSQTKVNQPSRSFYKKSEEPATESRFDAKSEPTESLSELLDETEREEKPYLSSLNKQEEDESVDELSPEEIKKRAIFLEKKGLTIEEIAKNLRRGKTEIELILQFRQEN